MPELAEVLLLASQMAGLFNVPLVTDADLSLPTLETQVVDLHPSVSVESAAWPYSHVGGVSFTVADIRHCGKKMWLCAATGPSVEVSFGMTGRFSMSPTQHDRVTFSTRTGSFFYSDIRKFGTLRWTTDCTAPAPSVSRVHDPEIIFSRIVGLTFKRALLDQRRAVSGVGNYLLNEALFACGYHPELKIKDADQVDKILRELRRLCQDSLLAGGCTLRDFRDVYGRPGLFQERLLIYGKSICPLCGTAVKKFGQPTSHVCPSCQTIPTDPFCED